MTTRSGTATGPATTHDGGLGRERAIQLRLEELLGPVADWSPSLVEALVTSFLSRAADYLQTLQAAVSGRDADAVARDSHSLKGMAGNLGARDLAALSEALETCGRLGQLSAAPRLLARLGSELETVRPAMLSVLTLTR